MKIEFSRTESEKNFDLNFLPFKLSQNIKTNVNENNEKIYEFLKFFIWDESSLKNTEPFLQCFRITIVSYDRNRSVACYYITGV